MKKCVPLSKTKYRKYLEKKKRSELIEILSELGCFVNLNTSKEELIEKIINLTKESKNPTKHKENKIKINDDEFNDVIRRLIYTFVIILIFQSIYIFTQFSYTIFFHDYCDSNSKIKRCIRCPPNAICHKKKMKCVENFTYYNEFCLPNSSDYKQLHPLIVMAKDKLKKRAGSYKCKESRNEWMSQDEIENVLFKYYQSKKDFINLFSLTIEYLLNETSIKTKTIENSTVFVSTEIKKSNKCLLKSMFFHSSILFSITIIINIYYYRQKKKAIYEIQANQCIHTIVSFIKSSYLREVAQTELKSLTEPMVKNNDAVWKIIAKKLENSSTIGWKKVHGEIYYFIDSN